MSARPLRRITRRGLLIGGAAGLSSLAFGSAMTSVRRTTDFDICIVGSGFAGIPLALRCVEQGLSVAVVEAGGALASSFKYRTSGDFDYPLGSARLIALGGTSGMWSGVTTRLRPADFKMHTLYGDWVDWPIDYDVLEPYYCQAEKFMNVSGWPAAAEVQPPRSCAYPLPTAEPYAGLSIEHDQHPLRFFGLPFARRNGKPLRLIDDEIPRFAASPRATLLEGERVISMATLDGESIDHIRTQNSAGDVSSISARVFVLASGVVESPRLLLMSRSKWFPNGLGNNAGLVGRYFTYHRHFFTPRFQSEAAGGVPPGFNRTHGHDHMLRSQHLNACNYQVNRINRAPSDNRGLSVWLSPEVEPRADNRVTLASDDVDSLGLPTPDIHFTHSERDVKTFRYVKRLGNELQRQFAAPKLHHYQSHIHNHPAGTTRMGLDTSTGVVDRNLKVFGLDNLYVSGASVFPVSGTANPTDTVVALTLRLADHLIERVHG